jgi:hypothetical protein
VNRNAAAFAGASVLRGSGRHAILKVSLGRAEPRRPCVCAAQSQTPFSAGGRRRGREPHAVQDERRERGIPGQDGDSAASTAATLATDIEAHLLNDGREIPHALRRHGAIGTKIFGGQSRGRAVYQSCLLREML